LAPLFVGFFLEDFQGGFEVGGRVGVGGAALKNRTYRTGVPCS
jgi:hypothetical protein